MVWEHCAKDDRFTIIHADINTWEIPEESSWDVVWLDTWLTHEETVDDYSSRMREKFGPYCDNVGGWEWSE